MVEMQPPQTDRTVSHRDGGDVPWWTPTWRDLARQLGWKWMLALPAIALAAWGIASIVRGEMRAPLFLAGAKILALSLVLPFLLLLEFGRHAIAARKEPFCIHCGYGLSGLPDDHTCPECGRRYRFAWIDEYRRDPHGFRQRYRMGEFAEQE